MTKLFLSSALLLTLFISACSSPSSNTLQNINNQSDVDLLSLLENQVLDISTEGIEASDETIQFKAELNALVVQSSNDETGVYKLSGDTYRSYKVIDDYYFPYDEKIYRLQAYTSRSLSSDGKIRYSNGLIKYYNEQQLVYTNTLKQVARNIEGLKTGTRFEVLKNPSGNVLRERKFIVRQDEHSSTESKEVITEKYSDYIKHQKNSSNKKRYRRLEFYNLGRESTITARVVIKMLAPIEMVSADDVSRSITLEFERGDSLRSFKGEFVSYNRNKGWEINIYNHNDQKVAVMHINAKDSLITIVKI